MRINNIFKEFKKTVGSLEEDLQQAQRNVLIKSANGVMTLTKRKTPVGNYKRTVNFTTRDGKEVKFRQSFVRIGGHLRKAWHISELRVKGKTMEKEMYNNMDYALYVNNGHRKVNRNGETVGFVEGKFFLEAGTRQFDRISNVFYKSEIERLKRKHGL
ncbi:MAG: HK97 gp10 family phage protein [Anaerorhabdus sp.]|uniref:HK97 gp10 family phage protein n=1 Tax=Anaerorhabdus sp. TaxID=1872524 RepID=UPI003A8B8AED